MTQIISESTKILLALSPISRIGGKTLQKIATFLQDSPLTIDQVLHSNNPVKEKIENAKGLNKIIETLQISGNTRWDKCINFAELQIHYAKRYEARIISIADPDYPSLLKKIKEDDIPPILFVKGNLLPQKNTVAIIGTRKPTEHGKIITQRITQFFVDHDWSIVSGLALGCDTIAHQVAVENSAHTIAVLGHGLEQIAPRTNKALAQAILDKGGALISQFPFHSTVSPANFYIRDKVQAGLSQGVVMVQSDCEGGSLHASRAAMEYQRWLAVPAPTPLDRQKPEDKVKANMLIFDEDDETIIKELNFESFVADNLIRLHTKADYPTLLARTSLASTPMEAPTEQGTLAF